VIGPPHSYPGFHWVEGSRAVVYINNERELRLQPLDGGPSRTLLTGPSEYIFSFAFTPDQQQVVYNSGRLTCDLTLIRNLYHR
jgi:hypothetical protein